MEKGRPRRSPVRALRASAAFPSTQQPIPEPGLGYRRSPSGFSPRALSHGNGLEPPPPPYDRCRGLRSSHRRQQATTRYSTAFLPFPLLETEHPNLRQLFGFLIGALTSIFFLQKLSGIMCRPMSFYWIRTCCQDLTEFGLAMVGFSGKLESQARQAALQRLQQGQCYVPI